MRVAANQIHVICERNHCKTFEHIVTDIYFHGTLFRMHIRVGAGEKELDITIQMTREHALVQRPKQNRNGKKGS